MKLRFLTCSLLLVATCSPTAFFSLQSKRQKGIKAEDANEHHKKWLTEDVVYIIGPDEKKVFEGLTTPEEKESFIAQFWYRRDPDPTTPQNEFKEEHYRRIAYANERFHSGRPGWNTDRGRIYIRHGPPDDVEKYPGGGNYFRDPGEGGGTAVAHPWEKWVYRYVEGLGANIELEFYDPNHTREYRLAVNKEEKEALSDDPRSGRALAEIQGMNRRGSIPDIQLINPLRTSKREENSPLNAYARYAKLQSPPVVKYKDLANELVKVNVSYVNLPVRVRQDYVRLTDERVLVPVTLQLHNPDLSFTKNGDFSVARLAIYGRVTSINRRVVQQFEDDLQVSYRSDRLPEAKRGSIFQRILLMDSRARYKLELVVKDLTSGHIGVVENGIITPSFDPQKLTASSLILADFMQQLGEEPAQTQMFVLGDVRVIPSMLKQFSHHTPLGVYLQLYNVALDQKGPSPSLSVTFRIRKNDVLVKEVFDESGKSTQLYSDQRVVLIKQLHLSNLASGRYQLQVEVQDRISGQRVAVEDEFFVVEDPSPR